ncbi:MAG: glycoside hydrolase family 2 TIM barrel-domain containing protein, partial [Bacteroidota bacterium]
GDFNFYGGMYRDVWLHDVSNIHFNLSEYGDHGIFISTPGLNNQNAKVAIKSLINNQSRSRQRVRVTHKLLDATGLVIEEQSEKVLLQTGVNELFISIELDQYPNLWHPDHPYLYRLESSIEVDNSVIDFQSNAVGFRWFEFTADRGFFINGEPLKLMGANRHQDYSGLGNALSDDRHSADVALIKNMGSNFFRTSHYPQDRAVLNASDQLGLLVSMEIPLDHEITDSPEFLANSKHMMKEMIRQYYNHPSIIIWAYMNEMLLGRRWNRDQEIIQKIRLQAVELEVLTREEDSGRYTMIPNHGALDLYVKSGLTDIPMLVGWNLYHGWYEEDEQGASKFLDRYRELVPNKPVLITEYGAGSDPRIRSLSPERFDFSIEWQNRFHQNHLTQYFERDYLSGAAIWNLADFGSEARNDAVPKINSKGVISFDRQPKDAYYLYQAWLRKTPVIWIGSRNWNNRTIIEGNVHPIEIYTNAEEAELILNGKSLGEKKVSNHVATWSVAFIDGNNTIKAVSEINGKEISDVVNIQARILAPKKIDWYAGLSINCGATFHFDDPINDVTWISDYGFKGGDIFRPLNRGVGSDKTVFATVNDPIYQTHRVSPENYHFDVIPGTYEISFHWAEVQNGVEDRKFDVMVNGNTVLSAVDVLETAGFATAYSKKCVVYSNEKLKIEFRKISGDPMISGIQIRKIN